MIHCNQVITVQKITQYQKVQKLLSQLTDMKYFSSEEIYQRYIAEFGEIKKNSISWILYKLVKEDEITRIGRNKYGKPSTSGQRRFEYELSTKAKKVLDKVLFDFGEIQFQVWELRMLNEFLNHQLTTNVIFVEVEKGYEEFIFESIKEENEVNVLLKPDVKTFNQVLSNDIVVVLNLISETISNKNDGNKIVIEKIIVDLFANKYIKEIINKSEYQQIVDSMIERYTIDYATLNRYSLRRNKQNIVDQHVRKDQGEIL